MDSWIWISRWEDFQHYKPERDRAPAWIKTYNKQLDDDAYRDLTWVQRAILHDTRSAFSRSNGRLSAAPRQLSQRLGGRVTSAQLISLSDAGFIEFVSRATLDQRLELLYASHARARARRSKKLEVEKDTRAVTSTRDAARNGHGLTAQEHLSLVQQTIGDAPFATGDA